MFVKMKICILAFLIIAGVAGAVDVKELNALIVNSESLAGPNCRMQGGPTSYVVDVSIQNPSPDNALRITYMYYNSSLGDYVDGGKICDVKPSLREICKVNVYTITGGKNATEQIPFNLTGTYDTESYCGGPFCSARTMYMKAFNVTITHYTGFYEENVMKKIDSAKKEYDNASQMYNGCYNASALDLLQGAYSEISEARDELEICNMAKAQNMTNDAILKIREFESYQKLESCGNNTTQQNNTQNTSETGDHNVTPQNDTLEPNPLVNPPQPTNPPGTDNISNVTMSIAKGCMPFFILVGVLVAAVWSERSKSSA